MRKLPEDILFDSRLVDRHIRQGLITRQDYDDWLAKRPDVTDQGQALDAEGPAHAEPAADESAPAPTPSPTLPPG